MAVEAPERGISNSHMVGNVCPSVWTLLNCSTNSTLVANTLYGQRFIAHKTGRILSVHFFLNASSGNVDLAIYDCAPTTRARLWSAGSTAVGTAQSWQTFAPNLAVSEGDHFDVAIAFDNATASVGRDSSAVLNSVASGAPTMLAAPQGGGANKLAWTIVTSFPAPATLTETALVVTALLVPKIVVVIA